MIRTALLSVSDREGLGPLARLLHQNGVKLYATGGTAAFLRARKIPVRDVQSLTKFPEILGGRVKTLHPAIFAGLLARPDDEATLRRFRFPRIDILVANFYDFPSSGKMKDADMAERIDIGGVALVRAAAKNHACVLPLVSPTQYGEFAQRFLAGKAEDPEYRRRLAAVAWHEVADYDLKILRAGFNSLGVQMPRWYLEAYEEALSMRYGENPHQSAAFYLPLKKSGLPFELLHGKPLSYCNLLDVHAAVNIWRDCPRSPFCAILKHTNPCGASVGKDPADAFRRSFNGDPQSAFGGIVLLNRRVDAAVARAIAEKFFEVIVAPAFDAKARKILECKKSLCLLRVNPADISRIQNGMPQDIRSVLGGILIQGHDTSVLPASRWKFRTPRRPGKSTKADMDLAQRICKHVKSNAVVLVRNGQAIGIGAGQQSRVDSVRIAIDKARRYGHETVGSVCASDGFFPFADSVELLAKAGVTAIIEPGGSVRDDDVVAAAKKRGISLAFTGRRQFRH